MNVKTEKSFVVLMNAEEAGVILSMLKMVSGPSESLGRTVTNAMVKALENAGAIGVDAWDTDTWIAPLTEKTPTTWQDMITSTNEELDL